jgi:hypothetical protein
MVFENLAVKLKAQTDSFIAGIEAARDRAEELGDGLGALSRKASRADDSIEEAGDEAVETAGRFAVLSAGTQGLSLSFGVLTGSVATLTAGLGALLAVLAPLAAGFAAIGAIGASIGLTGFAGVALAATQRTERLKQELSTLADILLVELRPVTRAATNVLSRLITEFISISNRLAPTQRQISTIADSFQRLGINVINAIPPLVQAAAQLTAQFLPKIASSSDGLAGFAKNIRDLVTSEKFSKFISNITAAAKELGPEFKQIAVNLGNMTDKSTLKGLVTIADAFADILVIVTGVLAKLDAVFELLTKLRSTFGGLGSSNINAAGAADSVVGGGAPLPPRSPRAVIDNTPRSTRREAIVVENRIEGDERVIEDVSAEVTDRRLQEQRDRAVRNAGRGQP